MVHLKFAKTIYLSYAWLRRKKKEKMNKIEIFKFGFSTLLKVSELLERFFCVRIAKGSSLLYYVHVELNIH